MRRGLVKSAAVLCGMRKFILASTVAAGCVGAAVADDLPVLAFWQFNDPGDPYKDTSGQGKPLTTKTRPVIFQGGYARFTHEMKGELKRALAFNTCSGLTVECFLRLTSYHRAPYTVFTYYGWNGYETGFFGMWSGGDKQSSGVLHTSWKKKKVSSYTDGTEKLASDSDVLGDHRWHHVAFVLDVSSSDESVVKESKLYVDGVLQTKYTSSVHHGIGSVAPSTTDFCLGSCLDTIQGRAFSGISCSRQMPFEGDMDDVRITAAALEPGQFLTAPTVTETAHPSGAVTWTDGQAMPAAGADVYVPADAAIELDAETPSFSSVTVDGSIRFNSSNNCLRATTVHVGRGGRLLAGEPYGGTTAVSNRIFVSCADFILDEGGMVSACGAGFFGESDDAAASGPGAGTGAGGQDNKLSGASHGSYNSTGGLGRGAYGSAAWPESAGSGGVRPTKDHDIDASNGGGVIRIDATGTVTVDGAILADALDLVDYVVYGRAGAGAGGSVLITCAKLVGSGNISAQGGRASGMTAQSGPGAGGRIAVHYDSALQSAADIADMTFDVQPGRKSYSDFYALAESGYWMYAGAGTLWFTDAKVLTASTLPHMHGRLANAAEVTVDGDLALTNWLGFGTDGAQVKINGDLTLSGRDARLEMGAVAQQVNVNANQQRKSYVSKITSVLDVSGDLVVTNAARFDVYAAATNGVAWHGAVVRVGGTFVVATNSLVYPFADPTNGGAPVFQAKNFDVNPGGTFGVVGGGFSGCRGQAGYGPGVGRGDVSSSSYGAGHGGVGGGVVTVTGETVTTNTTAYGRAYDDAERPTLAGSGGGNGWTGMNGGGCGGCVVHLRATEAIAVGGLITANGTTPGGHTNGSAAGSGGSVLLEAKSVTFGPAAKVTADGGASAGGSNPSSGGAGGRIAVWTGANLWEPGWRKSRYSAADVVPTDWTDVFSVAGGAKNTTGKGGAGEDGTLRFVTTFPPSGIMILVR